MNISGMLHQEVTVLPYEAGAEDAYGNVADAWGVGVAYAGRLEQTDGTEVQVGSDTEISNWLLFLPPDAVISGRDRIEADGQTFTVAGPPAYQRSVSGEVTHVEARLRSVQ